MNCMMWEVRRFIKDGRLRLRPRLQTNTLTPTAVPTPVIKKCLTLTPVLTPAITVHRHRWAQKCLTPVPTLTPNLQKMESTPGMTPESESPIFGFHIIEP